MFRVNSELINATSHLKCIREWILTNPFIRYYGWIQYHSFTLIWFSCACTFPPVHHSLWSIWHSRRFNAMIFRRDLMRRDRFVCFCMLSVCVVRAWKLFHAAVNQFLINKCDQSSSAHHFQLRFKKKEQQNIEKLERQRNTSNNHNNTLKNQCQWWILSAVIIVVSLASLNHNTHINSKNTFASIDHHWKMERTHENVVVR